MISKTRYITSFTTIQKYIWMVLVLFSMASCSVKESFFDQLGLAVEKPLNRNKTVSSCQFTSIEKTSEVQSEVIKNNIISFINIPLCCTRYTSSNSVSDFNEIKNNSPPYYILFQQLKIALVA